MPTKKPLIGLEWLYFRMEELGLSSLEEVAIKGNLNRGNLYRYFNFETRPSIDVIPKLCHSLEVSPLEILRALGIQS